mmetsp:Transcript_28667/g.68382  ORF Transcript_28667/g.68382 Transcript_28667/m.68382 type:complete len:218 (-) Transcript_28667:527-1180(-)
MPGRPGNQMGKIGKKCTTVPAPRTPVGKMKIMAVGETLVQAAEKDANRITATELGAAGRKGMIAVRQTGEGIRTAAAKGKGTEIARMTGQDTGAAAKTGEGRGAATRMTIAGDDGKGKTMPGAIERPARGSEPPAGAAARTTPRLQNQAHRGGPRTPERPAAQENACGMTARRRTEGRPRAQPTNPERRSRPRRRPRSRRTRARQAGCTSPPSSWRR